MEPDEYEHIPWSALVTEHRDRRSRILYLAAAVIAAVVVGIVGARILASGSSGTVVTVPAESVAEAGDGPVIGGSETDGQGTTVAPVESTPAAGATTPADLLAEADLMAVLPEEEQRAAAAWAEIAITDFFTVDGAESAGYAFLPLTRGIAGSDLPHGRAPGVAFVEWARALEVVPTTGGVYEVTVAFSQIIEVGSFFEREPVRAVVIPISLDGDGTPRLEGLPAPAALPALGAAEAEPEALEDLSESTETVLTEMLVEWGVEPTVLGAMFDRQGRLARVMVEIGGISWPLQVAID